MLRRLRPPVLRTCRRHISALYITGDKANQNYAILTPYFDFASRLSADPESLHANLRNRRSDLDLTQLLQLWDVYRSVQKKKSNLEARRIEIAATLKEMTRKGSELALDENLVRKYKADGTFVREDLKKLKESSYHMEDLFVHQFLALPNDIHPRTPVDEEDVIHSFMESKENDGTGRDHLNHTSLIEYHDPYCYFLRGKAAQFDLEVPFYVVNAFRKMGFVQFSNPDFCKSILAEAAGIPTSELLTVIDDAEVESTSVNKMHLTGAGSIVSYLGYIGKLSIFKSALPLRLVGSGRSYVRTGTEDSSKGLLGVTQSNQVQLFQAFENGRLAECAFDEIVSGLAEFYQRFGHPFRIVQVPAKDLQQAETMRVNVKMFSGFRGEFIEVGHLSYYGDYISKRLLFSYRDPNVKTDEPLFPHLIGGAAVDVSRLLAVLLENGTEFRVPDFIQNY